MSAKFAALRVLLVWISLQLTAPVQGQTNKVVAPLQIWVAQDGSGQFQSIQQALDALPLLTQDPQQWVMVRIGPGRYQEKVFLTRDKVVLAGSGKANTIIEYPELRQHFLARQQQEALPRGAGLSQDWGAAVVNIQASDIALLDLTVQNTYADVFPDDPLRFEHQFAVRGFETATRIITDQCALLTQGADTLSLWNKNDGMYYHSRCQFQGRVDMVCPRGSAWITHSRFYNLSQSATLWHDGELSPHQQLVVQHSHFEGVAGFQLGRRHYDAQFYLLHNHFSATLADQPIFRKTYPEQPSRDQANLWGDRVYLFNNQGPAYAWLADNITAADAAKVTVEQVFQGQWQPELQLAQFRTWLAKPTASATDWTKK